MKNNIIYFFSILIIEIGLLLQWFTLRRITMIVVFFLLVIINSILLNILFNQIPWFTQILLGLFGGWYVTAFIEWNFKKEDYEKSFNNR